MLPNEIYSVRISARHLLATASLPPALPPLPLPQSPHSRLDGRRGAATTDAERLLSFVEDRRLRHGFGHGLVRRCRDGGGSCPATAISAAASWRPPRRSSRRARRSVIVFLRSLSAFCSSTRRSLRRVRVSVGLGQPAAQLIDLSLLALDSLLQAQRVIALGLQVACAGC